MREARRKIEVALQQATFALELLCLGEAYVCLCTALEKMFVHRGKCVCALQVEGNVCAQRSVCALHWRKYLCTAG